MQASVVYKALTLAVLIKTYPASETLAETKDGLCHPQADQIFPGYIIGFGEGTSFLEAKKMALADLTLKVSSYTEVTSLTHATSEGTKHAEEIYSHGELSTAPLETLHTCEKEDGFSVVIGMSKLKTRGRILERAEARVNTLTALEIAAKLSEKRLQSIKREHENDRNLWLLIQSIGSGYPEIDFSLFTPNAEDKKPKVTIYEHLDAEDQLISKKTEHLAHELLENDLSYYSDGYSKNQCVWACQLTRGQAVYGTQRIDMTCKLTCDDKVLYKSTVQSVINQNSEFQQFDSLLIQKLENKGLERTKLRSPRFYPEKMD